MRLRTALWPRPRSVTWVEALARLAVFVGLLAVTAIAAACDHEPSRRAPVQPERAPAASVGFVHRLGKGEGRLVLAAPAGYAEDGSTDLKVDWVTPFERATRCEVSLKTVDESDELTRLLRTGDVDGIGASSEVVRRLAVARDVAPINTALVPRYREVFATLRDDEFARLRGRTYAVPFGRAANVLLWRTDVVAPAPTSWRAVFHAASPHRGRITIPDSPLSIAAAAVYLMAQRPALAIRDPYALDARQLRAATGLLEAQRRLVGRYWSDATKAEVEFARRDSVLGVTPQRIARNLRADEVRVKSVLPVEGSTGRAESWMLSSRARHPNCMYRWLDHVLSPAANAQAAQWLGHAPATPGACRVRRARRHCFLYHAADEAYFRRVRLAKTPLRDCGDTRGRVCTDYSQWTAAWNDIRS